MWDHERLISQDKARWAIHFDSAFIDLPLFSSSDGSHFAKDHDDSTAHPSGERSTQVRNRHWTRKFVFKCCILRSIFLMSRFHAVFKVTNCDYCKKPMFMQMKCKGCKCVHASHFQVYSCEKSSKAFFSSLNIHPLLILGFVAIGIVLTVYHSSAVWPNWAMVSGFFCRLCMSENECLKKCFVVGPVLLGGNHSPTVSRIISPPIHKKDKEHRGRQPLINVPFPMGAETCSNTSSSSCNSSTPSSPAPTSISQTPPLQNALHHFDFGGIVWMLVTAFVC